jgi:hypothetical protein
MPRPTFNLKIREVSALMGVIALVLALLVQRSTYKRSIVVLENKLNLMQSKQVFNRFMDVTFGDLGCFVIREPQEIQLLVFSAGGKNVGLDLSSPRDILSRFSADKARRLPNEFGLKFYNEFTSVSVDDQSSFFDPVPFAVLEFVRNRDRVLVISGKEGGKNYAKAFVMDENDDLKNSDYGWFEFDSSLIDRIVEGQRAFGSCEIGSDQEIPVRDLIGSQPSLALAPTIRDAANHPRVVRATRR